MIAQKRADLDDRARMVSGFADELLDERDAGVLDRRLLRMEFTNAGAIAVR